MLASDVMSDVPIANALADPIAATCVEVSAPNWDDVSATN